MRPIPDIRLRRSVLKRIRYSTHPRPFRDWSVLLAVFAALLLIGIVWTAYVYASVKRGDVISDSGVPVAPTVENASVQSIEDIFAQRASEAGRYENGAYTFVDPSK